MSVMMEQIISIILPILVIFPPAFMIYLITEDFLGMVVGALIGTVIGVYASIVPIWVLVVLILGLVSFLFRQTNVWAERGE